MKTETFKFIVVLLLPILLFSCESFIEVDLPQSQLTGTTVFENASTANAALSDIYAKLRESGVASGTTASATLLLGSYADDMEFYGNNNNIEQFNKHTLLASNTMLTSFWNVSYAQIYATNALLEGVQNSTAITGEDRNRLIGEALFIRAYIYFYMVNLFGDVPYIITTDYNQNAVAFKTPQAQVWQFISNDLVKAESLLPKSYPTSERVRTNKAVVTAMLARVYLYIGNWTEAENHAVAVIDNPDYSWESNPELVFLKNSPSIIWSLHPGIAGLNTNDARTFAFSSGPPSKSTLSINLYNAFEPSDLRKTLWIKTVINDLNTWYQPYKYKKNTVTPQAEEYTILFRLAEQYLIRAEARAHLGNISGAQDDLNKIRNRAGLNNTSANTPESLLTAILNERRFEFFTEQGHRWLDLKRTGNAANALSPVKLGWKSTDILLPLPEKELILNNNLLPQNPGY
ncbi:RagB/SusD family nutrient uptake outer membrane protein [Flavobacterium sp. GP15]|uniref:RagB/SusD family nutrient uptake outer membrane protein n=1 Tax=Flavobacterium sp. GP15 TaxID=2758567 RepID=UPI00165DC211|nr:RagB/SusD family nutrient uptake outer membrane protein [Flavobacterium sp. GP15]